MREARERFGLGGAGALGHDGCGWRGCIGRAWSEPAEMQHDEEPYDCQQSELVEKRCETMALPPPKRSERGAFYWFLKSMELSAEFGYTTRISARTQTVGK